MTRRGFLAAVVGALAARALSKPKWVTYPRDPTRCEGVVEVPPRHAMSMTMAVGGVVCYYPRSIAYMEGL